MKVNWHDPTTAIFMAIRGDVPRNYHHKSCALEPTWAQSIHMDRNTYEKSRRRSSGKAAKNLQHQKSVSTC